MHPNEELIERFYTCFQQKNYKGMQDCYASDAHFSDEAFTNLNSSQVCAMWEMLIKRGKDLQVEFSDIKANDVEGSADWIAKYTFSAARRPVENHIHARFRFANGKIIEHIDQFNFYTWSRQALGFPGWLLGWTTYLQHKVQKSAMQGLADFMNNQ
ncbi:nuclear transport factor 2 family protein [Flavihumibacter fluvii]|uniref:nuclear transport factor 2 family protein n=1 Tax=Flavihumibacter fluvii TaxID=2838157 RepID=UPI001BDF181C|nr:nuclear transport factor 2 family protein [Flavihumibacter fluvii]ULQ54189.1 nuclear transport factor 2 family protein [Flavihumibacter fluvii]